VGYIRSAGGFAIGRSYSANQYWCYHDVIEVLQIFH